MLPWIDSGIGSDGEDGEDSDVVDESALYDDDAIETGVTSGADPTSWESIGINRKPDNPGNSGEPGKP